MIISHKYNFIFIKTKKTAGTSIEVFLSQCCGADDIVTPIDPHLEPHDARNYRGIWNPLPEIIENKGHRYWATMKELARRRKFYNHIAARTIRKRISRTTWEGYFKFCVERNPWDKTLSHYHMVNDRTGHNTTLGEYLARQDFCLNYPTYTDLAGNLIIDEVIRYESLTDELSRVFANLGIPFDGTLGVRAKSEHRKDRRPYREVFSDTQRRVIEEAFAREIEMHSYDY